MINSKKNIIQIKSYLFSLEIVKLAYYLREEKREFILSKQLIRAGTSIGANIEEAIGGQSRKDFISKLSIAYKEVRETNYWIRMLNDLHLIPEKKFLDISYLLDEVRMILVKILKTSKLNKN